MTLKVLVRLLFASAALVVAAGTASFVWSDERAPLVGRALPIAISRPGQLAVGPAGDRLAIADRFANRVLIIDSRGTLLWSVGEGVTLNQPNAVQMTGAATVVFGEWSSRFILSVSEDRPQIIDTIADLTASPGKTGRIKRMYRLNDATYLVLTEHPDRLLQYAADWTSPRDVVKEGSGKGKLDRPVACALLPAGRIAVAGGGHLPVQLFDLTGRFLAAVDWNSPVPKAGWVADAIAIDQRERIWVADPTNARFRLYDLTGTFIYDVPFSSPLSKPCDMAVSSDNQLFVLNDNGRLEMYDLSRE